MISYSKTILALLLALLCVACENSSSGLNEDEYLSFAIPKGTQYNDVESFGLKGRSFSKEGEFNLVVYEVPIGLTYGEADSFLPVFGFPFLRGAEVSDDVIDSYPVKVYSTVMRGNYDIYTKTYVFSNGEKSVILLESKKDEPGNWWKENVKWNIPQTSDLPLEERLKQLANFIKSVSPDADKQLEIIASDQDKTVNLKIVTDSETYVKDDLTRTSRKEDWQLLNCFDVIGEYEAQNYDFVFTVYDKAGNQLDQILLPYSEYSQWILEEEPE